MWSFCKVFIVKKLNEIAVLGMGLLGGSITLAVLRSLPKIKAVGFSHRPSTRKKARQLGVATKVVDCLAESLCRADLVILATPVFTFEQIFDEIADSLKPGCIVTDVGSTKLLAHRWAAKALPKNVYYVGSHPIAGSEQRGIEFARDDLFDGADCILTTTKTTNKTAVRTLKDFWSALGCCVKMMSPAKHDKIFADVSHLPHLTAVALVNANDPDELKFAGKGFMDSSRVASGPANIWVDILLTNVGNAAKGIDKVTAELGKLKKAIETGNRKQLEKLLDNARDKRGKLIRDKIRAKEMES